MCPSFITYRHKEQRGPPGRKASYKYKEEERTWQLERGCQLTQILLAEATPGGFGGLVRPNVRDKRMPLEIQPFELVRRDTSTAQEGRVKSSCQSNLCLLPTYFWTISLLSDRNKHDDCLQDNHSNTKACQYASFSKLIKH